MRVLIVESNDALANLWAGYLQRQGAEVAIAPSQDHAIRHISDRAVDVILLNLMLQGGGALGVADFASYRHPGLPVVFVTSSTFFSDGSIFNHVPNARAFVAAQTNPDDLAAIVSHCGKDQEPVGRNSLN